MTLDQLTKRRAFVVKLGGDRACGPINMLGNDVLVKISDVILLLLVHHS